MADALTEGPLGEEAAWAESPVAHRWGSRDVVYDHLPSPVL
jgi:hypothetical protein